MPVVYRNRVALVAGVLLILVALGLSMAHERAAVAWDQGLERHGGKVTVLDAGASPHDVADGVMVKLSGVPQVVRKPDDPQFRVSADSSELVRGVDMFQWREVRHGGQTIYEQDWVDHAVDSSRFKEPAGHANTQPFPFSGKVFRAGEVRLGNFVLDPAIVKSFPRVPRPIQPDFGRLPDNLQASFRISDGALYSSARPRHPQLGDLRIHWSAVPLDEVTVLARASGGRLIPAGSAADGAGFSVQLGQRTLTDIHADLPQPPRATRWWRVVVLALASLGAWLIVQRWRSGRTGVALAVATGVACTGIIVGCLWLTTQVATAAVAWCLALLALVYGGRTWKRST